MKCEYCKSDDCFSFYGHTCPERAPRATRITPRNKAIKPKYQKRVASHCGIPRSFFDTDGKRVMITRKVPMDIIYNN